MRSTSEEELREAFSLFDRDKDDQISSEELRALFESLGQHPTPHDLDAMIDQADSTMSNAISFADFKAVMHRISLRTQLNAAAACIVVDDDLETAAKTSSTSWFDKSIREVFVLLKSETDDSLDVAKLSELIRDLELTSSSDYNLDDDFLAKLVSEADLDQNPINFESIFCH
jgi:Ca2+-binding EF-hand superfamily protein